MCSPETVDAYKSDNLTSHGSDDQLDFQFDFEGDDSTRPSWHWKTTPAGMRATAQG